MLRNENERKIGPNWRRRSLSIFCRADSWPSWIPPSRTPDPFSARQLSRFRLRTNDGKISLTEPELGASVVMIGTAGAHNPESPATLGGETRMVIGCVGRR